MTWAQESVANRSFGMDGKSWVKKSENCRQLVQAASASAYRFHSSSSKDDGAGGRDYFREPLRWVQKDVFDDRCVAVLGKDHAPIVTRVREGQEEGLDRVKGRDGRMPHCGRPLLLLLLLLEGLGVAGDLARELRLLEISYELDEVDSVG